MFEAIYSLQFRINSDLRGINNYSFASFVTPSITLLCHSFSIYKNGLYRSSDFINNIVNKGLFYFRACDALMQLEFSHTKPYKN